ncbi:MAG: hypothetical protein ACKOSO_01755, partial [Actinomycetota bacterium]
PVGGILTHGRVTIDRGRHEVTVGDAAVQLAPKEFDLLWALLEERGHEQEAEGEQDAAHGRIMRPTRARRVREP